MKGPLLDGEDLKMATATENGDLNCDDDLKKKEKKIRDLKSALRNEENKLVLMKKIRQSQLQAQAHQHHQPLHPLPSHHQSHLQLTHPPPPPSHHHPGHHAHNHAPIEAHQPPMKAHQATSKPTSRSQIVLNPPINNRSIGRPQPPLGLLTGGHSPGHVLHPPPPSHGSSLARPGYTPISRTPVTTPPNVVLGYNVQDLRAQSLSHASTNQMKPGRQSEVIGNPIPFNLPTNSYNLQFIPLPLSASLIRVFISF